MTARPIGILAALFATACYGIPDDTKVDKLAVKAWGGAVGTCQELHIDLNAEIAARGVCDAVDPATGSAVPPETIEAIRVGIDTSDFDDSDPAPDCEGCATHTYTVYLSSDSANLGSRARIVPSAELVAALVPLSPP